MEWSDIRIFLAVARTGSFGAAARAVGVSHPTVSRRIQALEEHLGQPLFQRHSSGVLLTDGGTQLLVLAGEMEISALAIERRLVSEEAPTGKVLRISAPDWFATHVLPAAIESLLTEDPTILPEVMVSTRRYDLSRQEAHIAFRTVPFEDAGIVQCRLLTVAYGLYGKEGLASPVIGDGHGTRLVLMDTARHSYPEVDWLRQLLPHAKPIAVVNHRALQARLCTQGLGVAVLPRVIGDATPGLTRLLKDEVPPFRHVWMGYHEDMRELTKVRTMANIAVRLLGGSTIPARQ